jgi:hypothetical protein
MKMLYEQSFISFKSYKVWIVGVICDKLNEVLMYNSETYV